MLTRWTGDPTPEIAGTVPDFEITPSALRAGLDRHPAIRMIDAQAGQADADVRLADAGRRSDFGVNLAYQRRDPRFGDYVSAGITVSLPSSPVTARTRALPQLRPLPERSLPNARQRGALSKPISTPIWPIT
jgi:outer membrane protein TolC